MVSGGLLNSVVSAVIAGMVGALASLLVERAWRRHTAKQKEKTEP